MGKRIEYEPDQRADFECQFCWKVCKNAQGLSLHLGMMHADEFEPLGPYDLPWHLITEVDRGFDGVCWLMPKGTANVREYLHGALGCGDANPYLMHLCEIYGEGNKCVRPDHLKPGTAKNNTQMMVELSDGAFGEKISELAKKRFEDPAAREKNRAAQKKRYESPAARKKTSDANKKRFEDPAELEKLRVAREKRWADPAEREKIRKKSPCPDCGVDYNPPWMTRHKNEGKCA